MSTQCGFGSLQCGGISSAPSDEGAGADRRLRERKGKAFMYLNSFSPSVSATASVGASALQRCPPDTRTLVRGRQSVPHFAFSGFVKLLPTLFKLSHKIYCRNKSKLKVYISYYRIATCNFFIKFIAFIFIFKMRIDKLFGVAPHSILHLYNNTLLCYCQHFFVFFGRMILG